MTAPREPTNLGCSIDVSAGMDLTSPSRGDFAANEAVQQQLAQLTSVTRELVNVCKEQLSLLQRGEERFRRQQQAQRDEFQRWLREHPYMSGQCKQAHETIRRLLGQSIRDLVDFVDENEENLLESDFVRTDMVDRFGSVLNHVSTMHGLLKRLASVDQIASADGAEISY